MLSTFGIQWDLFLFDAHCGFFVLVCFCISSAQSTCVRSSHLIMQTVQKEACVKMSFSMICLV